MLSKLFWLRFEIDTNICECTIYKFVYCENNEKTFTSQSLNSIPFFHSLMPPQIWTDWKVYIVIIVALFRCVWCVYIDANNLLRRKIYLYTISRKTKCQIVGFQINIGNHKMKINHVVNIKYTDEKLQSYKK